MTEAVTVTLPPQIHDDIVVLQGQEIIRLRDLVQTSEVGPRDGYNPSEVTNVILFTTAST